MRQNEILHSMQYPIGYSVAKQFDQYKNKTHGLSYTHTYIANTNVEEKKREDNREVKKMD